jgi:hypothetical protein
MCKCRLSLSWVDEDTVRVEIHCKSVGKRYMDLGIKNCKSPKMLRKPGDDDDSRPDEVIYYLDRLNKAEEPHE